MTVCTPHSYAGPKGCPYCEIELLRMERDNAESEAEALKERIRRVRALMTGQEVSVGQLSRALDDD